MFSQSLLGVCHCWEMFIVYFSWNRLDGVYTNNNNNIAG